MKTKIFSRYGWIVLFAYFGLAYIVEEVSIIAAVCMVAPVITSFFWGRKWCGHFCPRGSFLNSIPRKHLIRTPRFLASKFIRIAFFVLLMSAFAIQIYMSDRSVISIGSILFRMVVVTTIFAVILGLIFGSRRWCTVCPMGTMAHIVSRISYFQKRAPRIVFLSDSCAACNMCGKKCPMKINPLSFQKKGVVDHPDCIKCNTCVYSCPTKKIGIA
ncbi:MAG TPA: 4Fe-4S binding protein [Spirochaetota bacterium]